MSFLMPMGSFHTQTGLLLHQRGWLILERDEGGRWRLSADAGAHQLVGRRVKVEGIRSDHDVLEVNRISAIDTGTIP